MVTHGYVDCYAARNLTPYPTPNPTPSSRLVLRRNSRLISLLICLRRFRCRSQQRHSGDRCLVRLEQMFPPQGSQGDLGGITDTEKTKLLFDVKLGVLGEKIRHLRLKIGRLGKFGFFFDVFRIRDIYLRTRPRNIALNYSNMTCYQKMRTTLSQQRST